MRYFKDPATQQVHGYDGTIAAFAPYIKSAVDRGWLEVTGSWPPAISKEKTQENISNAITSALNDGAQEWGYHDIVTAASYANSTNRQYAADAQALIKWRDDVWAWAIPRLETVIPGTSPAVLIAAMPDLPTQPRV